MNYEANRLQTFQEWPITSVISAERIAKAGFYYTGQAEVVQCFLCNTTISEWNFNDQAMARHQLANPQCQFVLHPLDTCNVPLITASNEAISPISRDNNSNENVTWTLPRLVQMEFMNYSDRLSAFKDWPIPNIVSPEALARSGFYYFKQTDVVECVYCRGRLKNWVPGDDPYQEHRKHFPNCDFYLKEEQDQNKKVDFGNVKLMPGTTSNLTELGIQNHLAPRQPKHATYEGRLHTFQGWPSNLNQTPEMLSDAGFYYLGSRDQVRCFHCGGGLRNWEDNDDAWVEHARWFPKCGYIVLVRGQDFIKQCVDSKQPSDPSLLSSVPDDSADISVTPSVSPTIVSPTIVSPTTVSPTTVSPITVSPISVSPTIVSPTIVSQERLIRRVTDGDLERLLGTPPAMAALELGLHVGRIKMALKRRMEQTGVPYVNADQLIEDATQIQLREEDNITTNQTPGSPSTELTHLLNQIISTAESASSSNVQTESAVNDEKKENNDEEQIISTSSVETESDNDMQSENHNSKTEQTVSLAEENRRLREARLCKICMDKEFAVVFLPCSHLSTCVFCASSLTHCPMCRQEIRATVRTFLV